MLHVHNCSVQIAISVTFKSFKSPATIGQPFIGTEPNCFCIVRNRFVVVASVASSHSAILVKVAPGSGTEGNGFCIVGYGSLKVFSLPTYNASRVVLQMISRLKANGDCHRRVHSLVVAALHA